MLALSPDQLDRLAESIPLEDGKHNAIVGTVDANGVKIAAIFSRADGNMRLEAAYRHEWSGENEVGLKVLASW